MSEKPTHEIGREVKENNEKIVSCLLELKMQRDDLIFLIQKQNEERQKLEMEMERLTYKLCLINKSMAQRLRAKSNYDATIEEIEEKYKKLKENSGDLKMSVEKNCDQLDSMINKKTSTDDMLDAKDAEIGVGLSSSEEEQMESEECVCIPNKDGKCIRENKLSKMIQASIAQAEVPTKLEKEQKIKEKESKMKKESKTQEKEPNIKNKAGGTGSNLEKYSQEKAAQTTIPQNKKETLASDDTFTTEKNRLNAVMSEYKETSRKQY